MKPKALKKKNKSLQEVVTPLQCNSKVDPFEIGYNVQTLVTKLVTLS